MKTLALVAVLLAGATLTLLLLQGRRAPAPQPTGPPASEAGVARGAAPALESSGAGPAEALEHLERSDAQEPQPERSAAGPELDGPQLAAGADSAVAGLLDGSADYDQLLGLALELLEGLGDDAEFERGPGGAAIFAVPDLPDGYSATVRVAPDWDAGPNRLKIDVRTPPSQDAFGASGDVSGAQLTLQLEQPPDDATAIFSGLSQFELKHSADLAEHLTAIGGAPLGGLLAVSEAGSNYTALLAKGAQVDGVACVQHSTVPAEPRSFTLRNERFQRLQEAAARMRPE